MSLGKGKTSLQAPKIVSPEQIIYVKNSDGNLMGTHRGCKVVLLMFMWLPLVLIFLSSSMCAKYKGDSCEKMA